MYVIVLILVTLAWNFMMWQISLRRTPYQLAWAVMTGASSLVGIPLAFAVTTTAHVSIAGAALLQLLAVVVPTLGAFCTEIAVTDSPNDKIGRWRQQHAAERQAAASSERLTSQWKVELRPDDGSDQVAIFIAQASSGADRLVGIADPISEEEGFHELKSKAEEMTGTYNALGVTPKSRALAVR